MQTKIKIIKRGELGSTIRPSLEKVETALQSERKTANTVKGWIAEWDARYRAVKAAAFSLLGSSSARTKTQRRTVKPVDIR